MSDEGNAIPPLTPEFIEAADVEAVTPIAAGRACVGPRARNLSDLAYAMWGRLPDGERCALAMRLGLDGPPMDLAAVAKEIRITKERAKSLIARAKDLLILAVDDPGLTADNLHSHLIAGHMRATARDAGA